MHVLCLLAPFASFRTVFILSCRFHPFPPFSSFPAVSILSRRPQLTTPKGGPFPHPTPRALELHEIPGIVQDYTRAAVNAIDAGFDGVEVSLHIFVMLSYSKALVKVLFQCTLAKWQLSNLCFRDGW